jgi:hypothetical protein
MEREEPLLQPAAEEQGDDLPDTNPEEPEAADPNPEEPEAAVAQDQK